MPPSQLLGPGLCSNINSLTPQFYSNWELWVSPVSASLSLFILSNDHSKYLYGLSLSLSISLYFKQWSDAAQTLSVSLSLSLSVWNNDLWSQPLVLLLSNDLMHRDSLSPSLYLSHYTRSQSLSLSTSLYSKQWSDAQGLGLTGMVGCIFISDTIFRRLQNRYSDIHIMITTLTPYQHQNLGTLLRRSFELCVTISSLSLNYFCLFSECQPVEIRQEINR